MKSLGPGRKILGLTLSLSIHLLLYFALDEPGERPTDVFSVEFVTLESELPEAPQISKPSKRSGSPRQLVLDPPSFERVGRGARHSEKGDVPVLVETETLHPSEWERSRSLDQRLVLFPVVEKVAARLESTLNYRQEFVTRGQQGVVTISLKLTGAGQLIEMRPASTEVDPQLTGWVLTVVQKALSKPVAEKIRERRVQVTLEVHFRISHPTSPRTQSPPQIVGNTILLDREGKGSPRYDLTFQTVNDNLFTRNFRNRSPDRSRVEWDLMYRKLEASSACETQRAGGACLIAGKIAIMLGETRDATKWLSIACEEGIEEACLLLASGER